MIQLTLTGSFEVLSPTLSAPLFWASAENMTRVHCSTKQRNRKRLEKVAGILLWCLKACSHWTHHSRDHPFKLYYLVILQIQTTALWKSLLQLHTIAFRCASSWSYFTSWMECKLPDLKKIFVSQRSHLQGCVNSYQSVTGLSKNINTLRFSFLQIAHMLEYIASWSEVAVGYSLAIFSLSWTYGNSLPF